MLFTSDCTIFLLGSCLLFEASLHVCDLWSLWLRGGVTGSLRTFVSSPQPEDVFLGFSAHILTLSENLMAGCRVSHQHESGKKTALKQHKGDFNSLSVSKQYVSVLQEEGLQKHRLTRGFDICIFPTSNKEQRLYLKLCSWWKCLGLTRSQWMTT